MSDILNHTDPDWTAYIQRTRELTHDERVIRERVVMEYLYDFSWYKACLRCGFRGEFCEDNAKRFREDPYCIWRVKTLSRERGLNPNPEERAIDDEHDKIDIIMQLKREANYFGPGSSAAARVSALGKLAQLKGMEPAKNVKAEVKTQSVMVVPAISSVDNWEQVAQAQQEQLQRETLQAIEKPNVH